MEFVRMLWEVLHVLVSLDLLKMAIIVQVITVYKTVNNFK